MSKPSNNKYVFLGLGGSGVNLLRRLQEMLRSQQPEGAPPRTLLLLVPMEFDPPDCHSTALTTRPQHPFTDAVATYMQMLHSAPAARKSQAVFIHVDDVMYPLLDTVKATAIHVAMNGRSRLLVHDIARDASRAGCGGYLAWTAGELLDCGPSAARVGRDFARELLTHGTDDETRAVLALLPDLYPEVAAKLPQVSARTLQPHSVAATTTILRVASKALQFIASGRQRTRLFEVLAERELENLRAYLKEDDPLLRWVALGATKLVVTSLCEAKRRSHRSDPAGFLSSLVDWMIDGVGTDEGTSRFAASKLLSILWLTFPKEMPAVAAERFESATRPARACIFASAVDSLEAAYRGNRQSEVPRFVEEDGQVRYVAPSKDPWKVFGDCVAASATRDRDFLRFANLKCERLRVWQGKLPRRHRTSPIGE